MLLWYKTYCHPASIGSLCLLLCLLPLKLYATEYNTQTTHQELVAQLTPAEALWLKTHTTINYTGHPNFLPLEAFDENGQHIGIAAGYLDRLEDMTGLQFNRIATNSLIDSLQLAVNNQVDIISGDKSSLILNKSFTSIEHYGRNNVALIMRKEEPTANSLYEVDSHGIAVITGYGYPERLRQEYPTIAFKEFETVQEGLNAVSNGDINTLLLPRTIGAYHLALGGYTDLKFVGTTDVSMCFTLFVNSQQTELLGILQKAFQLIEPHQRINIASHWSTPRKQLHNNLTVSLTKQERNYLKQISPIRFTGDPDWLPYEGFNDDGVYIGQVADHLDVIQNLLGIEFKIIQTSSWAESVQLMREGKIDILSETEHSILGDETFFTRPYSSNPVVIVMRHAENHVEDLNQIKHKKIALIKNYGNAIDIKSTYPTFPFLSVNNVKEGLISISTGAIDGMLINSAQAIFNIKYLGLNNIKIVGKTDVETRLAFAVNKNRGPLVNIINKTLITISNSPQQQSIYDKWNSVEYTEKTDYIVAYRILGALIVFVILAFLWGRQLKKDIEQKRRLTEELSLAKEQANEANHAKTTFLAMVSHELRTPLNGILGMLELLERANLNNKQLHMATIARHSSENLLGILNDVLDISKIEANKMDIILQATNVLALLEACVNTYSQNAYGKGLQLNVSIKPQLQQSMLIDPARIRQIVNNLLSNAIKFTEKGAVTITASLQEKDQQHYLIIRVSDTGIGISQNDQKRLFQEFSQFSDDIQHQSGGSGLGLNISHKLSQLMGGDITLKSQQHQGTEAIYTQPVSHHSTAITTKWSTYTFALLTHNEAVKDIIEDYSEYFGANIISPAIIPNTSAWLTDLLHSHNIKLLIIDQKLALSHNKAFYQYVHTLGCHVIHLVDQPDLSTNNAGKSYSTLNTNPLQASFFTSLADSFLGISNSSVPLSNVPEKALQRNTIQLLVAEDHLTNQILITQQLDYLGYTYTLVDNGQAAIEALQNTHYDGVLTDCHMPLIDGYQLTRHIRENNSATLPIIAMTANALDEEKKACFNSGMNDVLTKPLTLNALNDCLSQWFPNAMALNYTPAQKTHKNVILQTLCNMMNDKDAVYKMLDSYYFSTEQDLIDIHAALRNEDRQTIASISHRMLGAAKTVLANEMADLLTQLNQHSASMTLTEINTIIDQVKASFALYQNTMNKSNSTERTS